MSTQHTVPETRNAEFRAMAQGRTDYNVEVIPIHHPKHGYMMVVCATEEAVYITQEQAKVFFGLVDEQQRDELQAENVALCKWKKEMLAVWMPVDEYVRALPCMKLGYSVSAMALEIIKQHAELLDGIDKIINSNMITINDVKNPLRLLRKQSRGKV